MDRNRLEVALCTPGLANGLELSCPAARARAHSFSRILAGKSLSNFPHASRVSCSELLCVRERQATRRRATVPRPQTPPAPHSRSPPPDFAGSVSWPLSGLAPPAPLLRPNACELNLAGDGSLNRPMPRLAGTPSPHSLAPAPVPRRDTCCSTLHLDRQGLFASHAAGKADQHRLRRFNADSSPQWQ